MPSRKDSQRKQVDVLDLARQMQTELEYQTSRGVRLKIRAVSPVQIELALGQVEEEFRERGEPLDVPKWELRAQVPGVPEEEQVVQYFAHTEETLEDPDDPRQTMVNRAMWAAYEDAQERLLEEQGERRMRLFLLYGVELLDGGIPGVPEPGDAQSRLKAEGIGPWLQEPEYWVTLEKSMGIRDIPLEDPDELKLHWLQNVACDATDLMEMTVAWQIMSNPAGLDPDELDRFRGDLIGAVRRSIRTGLADTFSAIEDSLARPSAAD